MENNLPQGWAEIELSKITDYKKGKKPKKMQSTPFKGSLVYLDIKAIEKGNDEIFVDSESSNYTDENDLIVVWDGARAGWVAKSRVGAIGSTIMSLTPKIDKDFLLRYLQTQFNYIHSNHRGTGIPHVDPDIFWNIKIPIAPLPEQYRIVAKLDAVMQKVENTKQRFDKIIDITHFRKEIIKLAFIGDLSKKWRKVNQAKNSKGLLKTLLLITDKKGKISPTYFIPESGLPVIPSSWSWASFGQVGKIITGKTPSKKNVKFWSGNIPFVMPGDLNKSEDCLSLKEITETSEMVTKEGFQSVQNISDAAVLVCCIGTLGRVAIVKKQISFSQQLHAIVPHQNIDLEYLGYYCYLIKEFLEELWPKTTYMPIVNKTLFSTIPIPIPPYEEQLYIVNAIKNKLSSQTMLEARYTKAKAMLDKLPQSVLAKAFRGELVPQDPADEPASVLLERIKAEKENLAKGRKGKKTKNVSH